MRKRALGADKGKAGAGMSGNKQEQLEKNKNKPCPYTSTALTLVFTVKNRSDWVHENPICLAQMSCLAASSIAHQMTSKSHNRKCVKQ